MARCSYPPWCALLAACGFTAPAAIDAVTPIDATTDLDAADAADQAPDAPLPDARLPDARLPDAGFDVTTCPAGYVALPGITGSRYRLILTGATTWTQSADCNDDEAGDTHLVSIGGRDEAMALDAYLRATIPVPAMGAAYIGAIQRSDATQVGAGWINYDDTAFDPESWGVFEAVAQPDDRALDGMPSAEDQTQQAAALDLAAGYVRDTSGTAALGGLCECDGIPVGAAARQLILDDPNNPAPP